MILWYGFFNNSIIILSLSPFMFDIDATALERHRERVDKINQDLKAEYYV